MWKIIAFLSIAIAAFFIWKHQRLQPTELKSIYWVALALKVLAGLAVGLVYTYYYSVGDTFGYFNDSRVLYELFDAEPGTYFKFLFASENYPLVLDQLVNTQLRSLFLVKFVSLVGFFSNSNYWMIAIYFSLISFLSAWFVFKSVLKSYAKHNRAAILSFLFFPSVVFWSAGITKETLAIAALFLICGLTLKFLREKSVKAIDLLVIVISVYFLWNLKYYWAALFLPSAFTCVLVIAMRNRFIALSKPIMSAIIFMLVFSMLIFVVSRLHPNFYFERLLEVIVSNYETYLPLSGENAAVHFANLKGSWWSILVNSPWALFSGLFRPMFFEANSVFQLVISIENLILLLLTIYNLKNLRTAFQSPHLIQLIATVLFIVLLSIFLTLSTPNFGTLSRYRIACLPFFSYILLIKVLPSFSVYRNLDHP